MAKVVMYSTTNCAYCQRAKMLLEKKNIKYTEIKVDLHPELRDEMIRRSGRKTVPQIFINEQSIGGSDDLYALEREGKLALLLSSEET